MKKIFLLAAVGLMATASSMDAAKVYFDNTKNWAEVGTWQFNGPGTDAAGTTTKVTIDGHELYMADTNYKSIIFRNGNSWDNGKTTDLVVKDGEVWDASSTLIANIVDGAYVATGNVSPSNDAFYLLNSQEKWSAKPENLMAEENGVYTITKSFEAGAFFKIGTSDWETVYGGDPAVGNNDQGSTLTQIKAGNEYTLFEGKNTKNLYVPANLVNVTFTFNKETKLLTVSESGGGEIEERFWYCAWDLDEEEQGKSWVFGNKMELQEEGTYKIHVDCTDSNSDNNFFALFRGVTNNDWDDGTRYQPMNKVTGEAYTKDVLVNTDESFPIIQGTQACWTLGNGSWTIVLDPRDPNNISLSFDLGDSTGEANVLIDKSADTEWTGTYESFALEAVADQDGVYKWTGSLAKGDKLKFNIHGVDYYYDPSIGTIQGDDVDFDNNLTIDYPLAEGDGYVVFDYASEVTYTINVNDKTITADLSDAPRVTLTITNGTESTIHKVTRQENTRIYISHDIECKPGDCIDFRLLNTRYECNFANPTSTEGTTKVYTLTEADNESAAPALGLTERKNLIFTVDAENKTLTVAESENQPDPDPDPEYDYDFYIRGDIFTDGSEWTDKKMTLTDGKFVLADQTVYSGSFGIKVIDPSIVLGGDVTTQQVLWLAAMGESFKEVELDETLYPTDTNPVDFHIYGGTYTFTFDPDAMTLVITGEQTVFPTEGFEGWTVTLAGAMNGWEDSTDTVDVDDNGKAELVSEKISATTPFKFILKKGETGSTWYSINGSFALNTPLELAEGNDITIPGAATTKKYTFSFDFNATPYTVTVTEGVATGISEISANEGEAVYFNLQGVQIEKPENGLYIEVRNGQSRKVMVK